jgi:phenylpropionate dioxygenase-like ring-hydroxylating dioxygenase large terminal subunit
MSTDTALPSGADATPTFLRDLWYMAALARSLKPGQLRRQILLGEPVLLGRMKNGEAFALHDICPHRAVPLSAGRVMPENSVECPYHGWRFRADGVCSLIPSLVDGQEYDASKIRVRSYPVREQDGLLWIYFAANEREIAKPKNEPPRVPIKNAKPRWMESQTFRCGIDHAVIGLMDPAHGPYVHAHWWWHKKLHPKVKSYAPLSNGFVMTRHKPTKPVYGLLGGEVTTEITFELPSTRFENIGGRVLSRSFDVVGLTVCTPIDGETTHVTQIFYWPGWMGFIKPFFMAIGSTFLGDDRKIVELQREGLKYNPSLMLIQDSDVPAMWYHRLKKAWADSVASGTPFVNPVNERTLRWRS